ncbi:MAG: terminase small subunit [Clostridia bacterium]|nr:terminase small subunit [Clostridia bacterium]
MADKLTTKQRLFVKEYLVDLNATQAAIRAGYSENTARFIAAENLTKPNIQEAIQEAIKQREDKIDINSQWVLKRLVELSERCMQGTPVYDKEGNETGEWKFEANAANRSLELIGKHLGMFTDKVESKVTAENTNVNIDYSSLPDEALAEIEQAKGHDEIMKIVARYKK